MFKFLKTPLAPAAAGLCAGLAALAAPSALPAADYVDVSPRGGADYRAAGTPCYAVFHRQWNGNGRSLERLGPERVPTLDTLRYHDGAPLDDRVMSVTTGPGAVVTLYGGRNFRRMVEEVGPSRQENLVIPGVDSYELRCLAGPRPRARTGPPPSYK